MGSRCFGEKNGLWKGGRTVASNGYVLVRVGPDHHLADVRGYAYEHRVVAEETIGRRLQPGEQVHHINGDKTDNRPENLEVMADLAHHRVKHRRSGAERRIPGESNPLITCQCGCGEAIHKYDRSGRARSYVSGHNPQPSPTADQIIALLSNETRALPSIVTDSGLSERAVKTCLSKLCKSGAVVRVGRGVYALPSKGGA